MLALTVAESREGGRYGYRGNESLYLKIMQNEIQ